MAEQVNVCVRNFEVNEIEVYRELADGTRDLNSTIEGGEEDTIFLPEPGVFLVISTPDGKDTQDCPFGVTLNEEVVEWAVMDNHHWKMQVSENARPPEVPTDVNVDVGEEPPAP